MNFAQVKQANGQNVTMFGIFNEIGGVSFTQNQKPVCKCQITDDNGEKHLIRIYNQQMPMPTMLNMRQQFTLSSYQGQNRQGQPYTGYSGFWDDRAQVNQVSGTPPQAQQAPQQPAQRPNVSQPAPQGMKMPDTYAYPVTPETADRMARAVCIEAMLHNGQKPVYSYVTELVEYIRTGRAPDPDLQWDENDACVHCGNPQQECSCQPKF